MLLACRHVEKRFGRGEATFYALKDINLDLPSSGLFAIKGRSGSGKSTLLNILSGLDKPSKGAVYYRGKKLSSFSKDEWQTYREKEIAFLFQHYNLISGLTAQENVALPSQIAGEKNANKKAIALLKEFGLGKLRKRKVDTLSGGEKQRVALCRALIRKPRVLFADEPTGALDEKNSKLVMEALKKTSEKRLVVLVSHNEELVKGYADQIYVLGEKQEIGEIPKEKQLPPKKRGGFAWIYPFFRKNSRRNLFKNVVAFCSGIIGFLSFFECVGFFVNSPKAIAEAATKTLGYPVASLSKEEAIELPSSPLKLVKKTCPTSAEANAFLSSVPSATAEDDYSYFFPISMGYELSGEKAEPVSFEPIHDITLEEYGKELLAKGEAPFSNDFSVAIVNEEFASIWGEVIGKRIVVSHQATVSKDGRSGSVGIVGDFTVLGVVREFSFLNSPKVYYSYRGLKEKLRKTLIPGIGQDVVSFLAAEEGDSPYACYRKTVFVHEVKEVSKLYALIEQKEEDGFCLSSDSKTIGEAFRDLTNALSASLGLFLSVAMGGLVLSLSMTAFSHFSSSKKEVALLRLFGASERGISLLYCIEDILVAAFSCLLSFLVSIPLEKIVNSYLDREFGVSSLIQFPYRYFGNPAWMGLLVFASAGLFGFFCGYLPLKIAGKVSLSGELRDE